MSFPSFSTGEVLTAADMNAVGLWLVKTQTIGTGVSSVTVTGAFSAEYDHYKVILSGVGTSTGNSIGCHFGSVTTNYYGTLIYNRPNVSTVLGLGESNVSRFGFVGVGVTQGVSSFFEVYQPFLTQRTAVSAPIAEFATTGVFGIYNGFLDQTTSFTAFTLTPLSGTLTGGQISVYGYKK